VDLFSWESSSGSSEQGTTELVLFSVDRTKKGCLCRNDPMVKQSRAAGERGRSTTKVLTDVPID
jgi:hypothetical protein